MLENFVPAMLDIPKKRISNIKITNSEILPETINGKFSRLDLSMKVDDKLVNVEIQMKNEPDFRDRRFSTGQSFTRQSLKRSAESQIRITEESCGYNLSMRKVKRNLI